MFLHELQDAFVEYLRSRVRNGVITERALARLVGLSQPHMHHVLSGKRRLSPELMDRCLYQLRLSVLDLVDRARLVAYLDSETPEPFEHAYLPVLAGRFGPTCPWPTDVEEQIRYPVPARIASRMWHPVVVRTGLDVRMQPTIAEGDHLLLDQSREARLSVDENALYIIKRGKSGVVRRLRILGNQIHTAAEDSLNRPALWERLPAEGTSLLHFIRARAVLIAPDHDWT